MKTIVKILVPTDFSEISASAFPHATELAGRYGAEVTLLHVVALTPVISDEFFLEDQFLEYAETQMGELAKRFQSAGKLEARVTRDLSPARGILEFIERNGVSLVVMTTHGHSGVARFFMGSVAERVVRHAPCPVLTLGCHQESFRNDPNYRHVLVPVDFSSHSRAAAASAAEIAERYRARLTLLHVIQEKFQPEHYYYLPEQALSRDMDQIAWSARHSLQTAMEEAGIRTAELQVVVTGDSTHSEISRFAQAHEVDLIVMGTHGSSGMERILLGSTAEKLLRLAPCPVLTCSARGEEPT